MSDCPITGEAIVQSYDDPAQLGRRLKLRWLKTDPEIHVAQELLNEADDDGLAFLTATYELGEWCPHDPFARHARLRSTP